MDEYEKKFSEVSTKLDRIAGIMKHTLAVNLYTSGTTMRNIAKLLHLSNTEVVKMLKEVAKNK